MIRLGSPMPSTRLVPAVAIVLAAVAFPLFAGAQTTAPHSLSGDEVAIYNLIGEAHVVAGSGPDVEVDVTLGGPDAGKLRVESDGRDGRETLRVVYPGKKFVYPALGRGSSTQLRVTEEGTFGDTNAGGRIVQISGRGSGLEARADLVIRVPAGKSVRVYQAVGEVSANGVEADLRLDTAAASVTASSIRGALSIDVGSGTIEVSAIDGNLDLDTGSGDVQLTNVRGARVHVDTGSGTVTGAAIVASEISIDTGSGDIEMTGVESDAVSLDTGSGSVGVLLHGDVESIAIDTGSGNVRIAVPPTLGAEVRIETGSGEIDVEVPHDGARMRDSYFRGRIGDGAGQIHVETGSGSVTIVGA